MYSSRSPCLTTILNNPSPYTHTMSSLAPTVYKDWRPLANDIKGLSDYEFHTVRIEEFGNIDMSDFYQSCPDVFFQVTFVGGEKELTIVYQRIQEDPSSMKAGEKFVCRRRGCSFTNRDGFQITDHPYTPALLLVNFFK